MTHHAGSCIISIPAATVERKFISQDSIRDLRPIMFSSALLTTARQYTSSLCRSNREKNMLVICISPKLNNC